MAQARTSAGAEWLIVSVKALGDFLIAFRSLSAVESPPGAPAARILVGEHLRDFVVAVGATGHVRFIDCGRDYPATWDIKRRGLAAGLRNLWLLRKRFNTLPPDSALIFDQLGWRERFLGIPHRCEALQAAPNVYEAYRQTLARIGFAVTDSAGDPELPPAGADGIIRIYAQSRIAAKNLTAGVVARIAGDIAAAGLRCEVIALGDEQPAVPASVAVRRIERSFTALIDSIRGATAVVSADSLPGHLADYLGKPAHVISPQPNEYWLPLSCFDTGSWSVFADERAFPQWLRRLA